MTDNYDQIDNLNPATDNDLSARGTELVYDTVESSRLLTLPATEIKYYQPDARDRWNADSDEVMLLLQFFNNCIVSGDARSLELARRAFDNLHEQDDEALLETLCFTLATWLPDDELLTYFDPENQPFFRRYHMAVVLGDRHGLRSAESRGAVYSLLKAQFKAMLKTEPTGSEALFDSALALSELKDHRAIPLLRRYAQDLKGDPQDPNRVPQAQEQYMMMLSILRELGGFVDDLQNGF